MQIHIYIHIHSFHSLPSIFHTHVGSPRRRRSTKCGFLKALGGIAGCGERPRRYAQNPPGVREIPPNEVGGGAQVAYSFPLAEYFFTPHCESLLLLSSNPRTLFLTPEADF